MGPPNIRQPAPPTHFSPILPALNQKLGTPSNLLKKFELKSEEKKNCNRAKPTASPIDYRGSSLTESPRILNPKKKKKNQYSESEMKPITSLAEKSNPNTIYTKHKQNKL